MTEVERGAIWIGGADFLRSFSGDSFNDEPSLGLDRSGRPILDRVNTIFRGADGVKWIVAANGAWKQHGSSWLRFGSQDGLPGNLLAFCESTEGDLWVGSSQGVSMYFRDADTDPPQTFLENAPSSSQLSQIEGFSFSFSGRDKWQMNRGKRLYFQWRFDENAWSGFSEQNRSSPVGSLEEGIHSFEVRAMDVHGNVDPIPAIAQFEVFVPWFDDTRLRRLMGVAALVVLVFAGLAINRHLRLVRSHTEIEKIVDERTHQLELANRELAHSEKMRSLGTLAAGVAHDFNSILSIIRGSVQIIEANQDNHEKVQTRVNRIKSMVEQGSTLVKSMLGFSRADDTTLSLDDVDRVVEDSVQLLGDRLPVAVSVSVDISSNLPPVHGNRELLQQIIVNLVLNAVDALEGKGALILRCHHAHQMPDVWVLQPAESDEYVIVTVEDGGCGISADILSRIFEPFFTTKAFSTRHGTGLGLSMVYEFCKELGYGLNVRSEQHRGTAFNIVIPVLKQS